MPTSQYLPFAAGPGTPNTMTYAAWSALTVLIGAGFQPGVAESEMVNTVLRQATTGVAGVAKFAADNGTVNLVDTGSAADFAAALMTAIDARIKTAQGWKTGDVKAATDANMANHPGWLMMNGQIVSRLGENAALFAVLGPSYAISADSFSIPDARGEFLRGIDMGRGVDSGRTMLSPQGDLFRSHTHTQGGGPLITHGFIAGGGDAFSTIVPRTETAPSGGAETRPRSIAVLWLIKL